MGSLDVYRVTASALDAQRQRLTVIASNLANVQTTHGPDGQAYRRREVVFQPFQVGPTAGAGLGPMTGVRVAKVVEDPTPGQVVLNPGHPDANGEGFVQMPNVNLMTEMVNMMAATRAYEANLQVVAATRAMTLRALAIGGV